MRERARHSLRDACWRWTLADKIDDAGDSAHEIVTFAELAIEGREEYAFALLALRLRPILGLL